MEHLVLSVTIIFEKSIISKTGVEYINCSLEVFSLYGGWFWWDNGMDSNKEWKEEKWELEWEWERETEGRREGGREEKNKDTTLDSYSPDLEYFLLIVCVISIGGFISGENCASSHFLYEPSWLLIYYLFIVSLGFCFVL